MQVHLKFTGDVWAQMRTGHLDFAFEGHTLGELLQALFAAYDLRDLIVDGGGSVRYRSRIAVNGRFSDTLQGMSTPVENGATIVLMRPGLGAN